MRRFSISLPAGASLELGERSLVMGILNVTPDSFSDGGRFRDHGHVLEVAGQMLDAGADIVNDVTAGHVMFSNGEFQQWSRSKSWPGFGPIGPVITTTEDIPNPQALMLSTRINGELRQSSSTGDMIWSCADLVHFFSFNFTLKPGMVILTGTPEGVGFARKPPIFLKPGDECVVKIEGVGELRNRCIADS